MLRVWVLNRDVCSVLLWKPMYLFVCWCVYKFSSHSTIFTGLFVWGFFWSHSRIVHSYGDVTIVGNWLQILTYVRHSWPLGNQGSFGFHTYWGTGHPFKNGHLQGPVALKNIAEYLAVGLSLFVFYEFGLSRLGFELPTFRLRGLQSLFSDYSVDWIAGTIHWRFSPWPFLKNKNMPNKAR